MPSPNGAFVALTKCFLCGEDSDLLIDRRLRDISRLHGKVVTHEPCAKCQELMKQGIILISVKDGETSDNPYRTGNWVVIKDEALRRFVTPADHPVFTQRFAFIEDGAWKKMGIPFKEPPACSNETSSKSS